MYLTWNLFNFNLPYLPTQNLKRLFGFGFRSIYTEIFCIYYLFLFFILFYFIHIKFTVKDTVAVTVTEIETEDEISIGCQNILMDCLCLLRKLVLR